VQSKTGCRSVNIYAIFRGSSLIKRSSLELGWKDLTIERRSGALGMPGMLPAVRAYTTTEVVACTLEPGFMSKVDEDLDPHPIRSLHDRLGMHDAGISQLMSLLAAEAETGGTYGKLYTDSLSYALATRFHYVARARKLQESSKDSRLPRRILRRVIERMQSDFSVNLDLETLATESGYSRAHFLRMFRAATGKTPHQYLLDLRLDEVQRRMRDPDERLIDIATECGFCSHSHLSKVFRQRFGVTPSEYRRQL
jgi:AraC family transcriptional regulator